MTEEERKQKEDILANEQSTILDAIRCLELCKEFVTPKENLHHLGTYILINENIIELAHLVKQKALQSID